MDADDVNQIHKATLHTWHLRLSNYNVNGIEKLASKYRNGDECECVKMSNGSFNWCFKVVFGDGTAWALRFPAAGNVMHREEKVRREVAVMKFLKERTSVPVPQVIAFGMSADNHDPEIGPFLITEWIEGILLSSIMEKLPRPEWGPVLRQDISEQTLYSIYRQIARILLELSMHSFDQIGALSMFEAADGTHSWPVQSAPMTLKMNEIERSGNVKVGDHSKKPFRTVTEYISSLVQQNITHLCEQRNSIDDADDARQKYILRQRVSCIAPSFVSDKHDSGPFKLICDDFRPGNILVKEDTLEILAVIDFEWTYAGPYQFLFSPPNWLILEEPTSWTTSSEARYQAKFQVFLQALEDEEAQVEIKRGIQDLPEEKMSVLMRQSMEDGKFWFNELIRQSFNFDEEVLWPHIEHHLTKIGLAEVGIPDQSEVEAFVRKKLLDLNQYKLDWHSLAKNKEGDARP